RSVDQVVIRNVGQEVEPPRCSAVMTARTGATATLEDRLLNEREGAVELLVAGARGAGRADQRERGTQREPGHDPQVRRPAVHVRPPAWSRIIVARRAKGTCDVRRRASRGGPPFQLPRPPAAG